MIDEYPLGQPVRLKVQFADEAGNAADVDSVQLTVKPRWGVAEVFQGSDVVKDAGTGLYEHVMTPAVPGDHFWEWSCSAPFVAVTKGMFTVAQRMVA